MLILYLVVLIIALYWVSRILLPEMTKKDSVASSQPNEPDKSTEKLEALLAEKNKNASLLQKELRIFQAQIRSFDKVKTLMDEEICRLREQNRIFRSKLGEPPVASSNVENSKTEQEAV